VNEKEKIVREKKGIVCYYVIALRKKKLQFERELKEN
jgi:hypothetical protein